MSEPISPQRENVYKSSATTAEPAPTLKEYLKSREFWVTIGVLAAAFLVTFVLFFTVFLPWYTNHNETVEVPDVTSKTGSRKFISLEDAENQLSEIGLNPVVVDSQYLPELPPRTIVKQDPIGLSLVKPGRRIYLTISRKSPPLVTVPRIVDGSLEQARYLLESWKLKEGEKTIVPGDGDPGWVLKAFYKGKEIDLRDTVPDRLPEGSLIDLHISKGLGAQKVKMPNLINMDVSQAIAEIQLLGLIPGAPHYDDSNDSEKDNKVYKQYPSAKIDSVRQGTVVELYIHGKDPTKLREGVDTMQTNKGRKNN